MARALRRGGAAHDRRADPDARRHDRRCGEPVPTTHGPRVLRRRDELPRARRADRRRRRGAAAARRQRRRPGRTRAAELPAARRRLLRRAAARRHRGRAQPALHAPRVAAPVRRPRSPGRDRLEQRRRHGRRVPERHPAGAHRRRRPDEGAAVRQADGPAPADPEGQALPRRAHDDPSGPRARGVGAPHLAAGAGHAASAPVARRHGRAAVHERHHRQAEGRRAQPPQPACQCDAGARLGAGPRRGRGGLLRGAAALPRLRHDALPDLRDEHRRPPRAVPEVRLEARARCGAPLAADVPARRAADLRPARARRRRAALAYSRASASPSRAR